MVLYCSSILTRLRAGEVAEFEHQRVEDDADDQRDENEGDRGDRHVTPVGVHDRFDGEQADQNSHDEHG